MSHNALPRRAPTRALHCLLALCAVTLGACASLDGDAGTDHHADDIVRLNLSAAPSRNVEEGTPTNAARIRREEQLRRELGVGQAPDGYHYGCFSRDWVPGC